MPLRSSLIRKREHVSINSRLEDDDLVDIWSKRDGVGGQLELYDVLSLWASRFAMRHE
jgi:hypothetical protein